MIAICIKNTKKLIKGYQYNLEYLTNKNGRGYAYIKNVGRFSVNNFRDVGGGILPQIDWFKKITPWTTDVIDDIKVGDILVCKSDRYKHLIDGKMYKISHVIDTGNKWKRYRVKFDGYGRFIDCNRCHLGN